MTRVPSRCARSVELPLVEDSRLHVRGAVSQSQIDVTVGHRSGS
jgi:hypothetical protein